MSCYLVHHHPSDAGRISMLTRAPADGAGLRGKSSRNWRMASIIVGGRIEAIVHTYKVKGTNNWNWKLVQCYLTLEEIRYAFQNVRRDELSEPF